ncbi:hypothetical protein LCGC14_0913740 [marine sediment metagenome]|uniref:Uncharacterized protein n=1 Tax=marine sediment metagenome TaxID=412755 RepID=A0A0F9RBL2_9ZZZZ
MIGLPETIAKPSFETLSSSDSAVIINKAATSGVLWVLDWVMYSISSGGTHIPGSLKITLNSVLTFDADFDQAEKGPFVWEFPGGYYGEIGKEMSITASRIVGRTIKVSTRFR